MIQNHVTSKMNTSLPSFSQFHFCFRDKKNEESEVPCHFILCCIHAYISHFNCFYYHPEC